MAYLGSTTISPSQRLQIMVLVSQGRAPTASSHLVPSNMLCVHQTHVSARHEDPPAMDGFLDQFQG